jgi:uncharacterized membrane protein
MLSRALGWFSVALGLSEFAIPRTLARAIGIKPRGSTAWLVRAMGVRELIAGASVLMQPHRPLPLWARVTGDAIDLALLGAAARSRHLAVARLAGAAATVAGVTAIDVFAARRSQRAFREANRPVICSVTINRPPTEVYAFYRRLSQLPLVMDYLASVREADRTFSHWVARLPRGGTIAWDAKITEDRPGEVIAWRSVQGSLIDMRGRVTFSPAPGRNMTEVRVEMQLGFGTRPSASVAAFFTRAQIEGDLQRLKQVLETHDTPSRLPFIPILPSVHKPAGSAANQRGARR